MRIESCYNSFLPEHLKKKPQRGDTWEEMVEKYGVKGAERRMEFRVMYKERLRKC